MNLVAPQEIEQKPGCITSALKIIGDKWTALIIRDLASAPHTFGELEANLVGISPRTLSQRLEMLMHEQIIIKTLYCQHPPRYNYSLTEKGTELENVLFSMAEWGAKYHSDNGCN
jgi:DNA-binding HxlR family transcriptional regulator